MRFLRKKREYVARREETKDKTIMDIKIHYVGRGRGDLEGYLEEIAGWISVRKIGVYNVGDLKKAI